MSRSNRYGSYTRILADPYYFSISRYMFWTDWGLFYPKIERADLSGENRRIVVDLAFWYFVLNQLAPMSVVIDYEAERIYWMDAYDNYIESTDYDGGNWRTVHYVSQNIFPADLALYGDNLYWVDWNSQSVQWLNKSRPLLMRNFGHLSDFYLPGAVVSDQSRQPVGKKYALFVIANVNMLFFPSAIRKEDRTNINWLWTKPHTDLFPNYSATVSPYFYNPETFSLLTEIKYTPHFASWYCRIIKKRKSWIMHLVIPL